MDELEVVWSYRPDDRSKQGKKEKLPADLARMKVREGLAVFPKPKPEPVEADSDTKGSAKESAPATAKALKQTTPPAS